MFSFKRKYFFNLGKSEEKISHDAHLSSLMDFSKQIRNRIIFFVLFNVYAFLNVLATTDKDIFLLNPVKMPLLNIELPLLAFYIVVPFMLVSLHFNLMYRLLSYRAFLKRSMENHRQTIDSLPFGIYEEILLGKDLLLKATLKVFFFFITYLMPVVVLLSFWYRFADYHDFTVSSYHLILAFISFVVAFYFVSIKKTLKPLTEANVYLKAKELIKSITGEEYFQILSKLLNWIVYYLIPLTFVSLFAWTFIYPYHLIIKEVSKYAEETINEKFIEDKESFIKDKFGFFIARFRGLEDYVEKPTLDVSGEILVKGVNKETLEILREFKNGDKPLLYYVLRTNYSGRNFSFANLTGSILINSDLKNVNLYSACLEEANLSGADLKEANLSGSYVKEADFSGTILVFTKLNGVCGDKNCSKPAVKRFSKKADLNKIKNEVLTEEKIKEIIKSWEELTKNWGGTYRRIFLKKWKNFLYQYKGKTMLDWIKAQNVDLGEFTEKDLKEFLHALILGLNKRRFVYEFKACIWYLLKNKRVSKAKVADFIKNYFKEEKDIITNKYKGFPFKKQVLQLLGEIEEELIKQYSSRNHR